MATINFPDSPSLNQTYTANTRNWTWNGNAWQLTTPIVTGPTGPTGPSGPSGPSGASGAPGASGATSTSAYVRTTVSSSALLANAASTSMNITGFKGYTLYKIQTSAAAWVRVYSSTAARTADTGRSITVDPTADSGVLAEVITASNVLAVPFSPTVAGYSAESTPSTNIPLTVTNVSGSSTTITVTLTLLQTEA